MKKNLISSTGAVLLVMAVLTFVYVKNDANKNNEIFNANVEALADEEEGSTTTDTYAICFYESRVRVGYTYYDCVTCTKKYDEKGKGDYSKCFGK